MSEIMKGVEEYAEGMDVELLRTDGAYEGLNLPRSGAGRWVVMAKNEAGYNCTEVDILQLVAWMKENKPDLLG